MFNTSKLCPIDDANVLEPLVVVACGSFSPITYLHMRMFEMACDTIKATKRFQLLGGYFSPVSDAYGKPGLAKGVDRVAMCNLALQESDWLMVDSWESEQTTFQPTAVVLDHFEECLNRSRSPLERRIKVMLLAGGDLLESFQIKGLWEEQHLHHILRDYGCLVLERTGSDVHAFLLENDLLYQYRNNILVIKQLIHNDISSSRVRLFVKRGFSIRYLVPDAVIDYIYKNALFQV